MNVENQEKKRGGRGLRVGRECAYLAVFVAFTIVAQLCFTFLPSVEVVTLLFIAYSVAFGWKRGMLAATAFSLLRQLIFGFFPTVLIVYLFYYNMLAFLFGFLGRWVKNPLRALGWVLPLSCLCAASFTLFDCLLTPLWYGYARKAAQAYFFTALPFMATQIACVAITVALLFVPLVRVFRFAKRQLVRS